MKVLVIGSGGREHALCWKLSQSPLLSKLFCAPGNSGIAEVAELVPFAAENIEDLLNFALKNAVDLTVVGPEGALALGIVDRFQQAGLKIFGPSQLAARIESSKEFSKQVMNAAKVSTPQAEAVDSREAAEATLGRVGLPIVLKADGLAAGKGVRVCFTTAEVAAALDYLFGELGCQSLLVEQFIEGLEASLIVATDGEQVFCLPSSHDYKRIGEGNTGLNTGGMGTLSPTPNLSSQQIEDAIESVIKPTLIEMRRRGAPLQGFLYAGLMISRTGVVNVIEFNARLGDPECQSIMRRIDGDFLALLWALVNPGKELPEMAESLEAAACVVLASGGYPLSPTSGDLITGINEARQLPGIEIFHCGTALINGQLLTAGGRVINVTATAPTITEALARAYAAVELISFRGIQYRRDIGGPNA